MLLPITIKFLYDKEKEYRKTQSIEDFVSEMEALAFGICSPIFLFWSYRFGGLLYELCSNRW